VSNYLVLCCCSLYWMSHYPWFQRNHNGYEYPMTDNVHVSPSPWSPECDCKDNKAEHPFSIFSYHICFLLLCLTTFWPTTLYIFGHWDMVKMAYGRWSILRIVSHGVYYPYYGKTIGNKYQEKTSRSKRRKSVSKQSVYDCSPEKTRVGASA